ncbi:MAG: cytochrome C [Desulfuromonadales bacterium]|nr:cytochrome C [Desulfuromonadales bacterium]NIR33788.1 cytochrome C [Desulfuromonadales bacterium]NIS42472.1 cytochrome C [Desulfuromonadales bacterium]
MRYLFFALSAATLLTPSLSLATEAPNKEMGQTLFHSDELGTNGRSCATCHPSGEGLEEIQGWETPLLKQQINDCIRGALEGAPLDNDSTEMNSLIIYLRSF